MFEYDFDRFTKALNLPGFDLVLLLDANGTVLAEKSTASVDLGLIADHFSSIVQLAESLAGHLNGGTLRTAALEFEKRRVLFGTVNGFIVCGVPGNGTPTVYARNEITSAIEMLV